MLRQYNRNIRHHDYAIGQLVWLKVKYYKTGETRKFPPPPPRRDGPWVIVEKLPNGVNSKIRNAKTKESKIVHHDRLSQAKELLNSPESRNYENAVPADKIRSDYSDGESSSYTHGHNDSDFETDSHTSDSEYESKNGGRGDESP